MERSRGSNGRFSKNEVPAEVSQESQDADKAQEPTLDPKALAAFDYLTNKTDYSHMTYDEIMAADAGIDDIQSLDRRRTRQRYEHTLFLADLLVGSKFSDNELFNDVVERVAALPAEQKPDQVVITGLYMGDFGGRKKNSRWMLQNGLRSLDEQFYHGKAKLDQLKEIGAPIVYGMSDNDTDIVEEMTFEAFNQMDQLAKKHARENRESDDVKRQLSKLEKAKANPNWPEYYRFTQEVAFPYCVRSGELSVQLTKSLPMPLTSQRS